MPTVTFYPDADPESTSVDGHARQSGPDSWAAIHGGAGSSSDDSSISSSAGIFASNDSGNPWDVINRIILLFDTSGLPDWAIPTAATLTVAHSNPNDEFAEAQSVVLTGSSPTSNTSLSAGDFAHLGATEYADRVLLTDIPASPLPLVLTLNASGLAAIDVGGVTKFGLWLSSDFDDVEPTWSDSAAAILVIDMAENSGTKPQLDVAYDAATAYSLTGPSSGTVNSASTDFTVAPIGAGSDATVTPASSGAGSFTPPTVTFSGTGAQTFTYTPTSTAGSPHTISVTNNGGLTNPGSLSYTVNGVMAQEDYQYLHLNRLVIFQQQTPAVALPIPETIEFVQPLFDDEGGLFHQTTEE